MPEADSGDVATYNSLFREGSKDIDLAKRMLDGHGAKATREVKRLLEAPGESGDYDTIVGYDGSSDDDEQAEYDALVEAEALLVYYYALKYMNLRLTKKGGLSRSIRGSTQNSDQQLMSQAELKAYRNDIYHDAAEIIAELRDENDRPPVYAM